MQTHTVDFVFSSGVYAYSLSILHFIIEYALIRFVCLFFCVCVRVCVRVCLYTFACLCVVSSCRNMRLKIHVQMMWLNHVLIKSPEMTRLWQRRLRFYRTMVSSLV